MISRKWAIAALSASTIAGLSVYLATMWHGPTAVSGGTFWMAFATFINTVIIGYYGFNQEPEQ